VTVPALIITSSVPSDGGGALNVNADHFALVYDGSNVSSALNVGVGGTVTSSGTFYMNDDTGTNLTSTVNMMGGTMSVARIIVNDDPAAGTATAQFNLSSGTVNTGGFVFDWFGRNDSTVNITGGSLTGTGALQFGSGGTSGTAANLFNLGGGVVQFDDLEFNSPNSKLAFFRCAYWLGWLGSHLAPRKVKRYRIGD